MLHDLSFLDTGQIFPPVCETERLQNYKDNLLLFNDSTYLVSKQNYKDSRVRVIRILNDFQDLVGYPVELNYHKLTSVSVADLMCGEKPIIKLDKTDDGQKASEMLGKVDFYGKLYQWAIDISRYGDAVVRSYTKKEQDQTQGKAAVAVMQPSSYFKVVNAEDKDDVIYKVLATPVELPNSTKTKPKWKLSIQIHDKGFYIKREMELKPVATSEVGDLVLPSGRTSLDLQLFEIGKQIGVDERVETGIAGFAVHSLHQLITSDSPYGHDDYASIDPILAEIWARMGQIALILDKHSRPDVYAALSAFEQDRQGVWHLKVGGGNTYIVNPGDIPPGYLTWDGQLVAAFNELNTLFEQLYKVSEMGPIYEAAGKNANIALETMKTTFVKPLAKVRRITNGITDELKQIIATIAELNGIQVKAEEISITWADGLPNDERQEIEKATMKIASGLSTPEQENIDRFGITAEQASLLAEKVKEYNADKQASMFGGFPNPADDGGYDE